MFEARLVQGSLFKKIIEAIRELVVDANLDCNESGITMQVRYVRMVAYVKCVDFSR
jgi:proliferating cell nuclear antigen